MFRPVWQSEIERELHRNAIKVQGKRWPDRTPEKLGADADRVIANMRGAFPDACLADKSWQGLVDQQTNDAKDRHVLAAAVAAEATHVVTDNMKDFPVSSRPEGALVQRPDSFLLSLLANDRQAVLSGLTALVQRNQRPPKTLDQLVETLLRGKHARRFAQAMLDGEPS